MRLSAFIRANTSQIVEEWKSFAQSLTPAADGMSPRALRDHIREILAFIVDDIDSAQTECERTEKSHGEKSKAPEQSAAEIHAALRQAGGFSMNQMVSEFRALRASVIRLWLGRLRGAADLDVSELIRFDESIDQQLIEAINYYSHKHDRSRELLLGILGHDLRNPIGSMRMSAQLAAKLGPLNDRQAMLVDQVASSGDRAIEILDNLLDLTRARLGSGLSVIKAPMNLAFVARQLVDEMRAMHPKRAFNIEVSGDTDGVWDRPRMGQVFSNLLGNAVQYGFTDRPISVTIKGNSEEVALSVCNEGVPIDPDLIGSIFLALSRGEGECGERQPGSTNLGLGLFITAEIIAAHGGRIDVTSSEKDGTAFTAHLPRSA